MLDIYVSPLLACEFIEVRNKAIVLLGWGQNSLKMLCKCLVIELKNKHKMDQQTELIGQYNNNNTNNDSNDNHSNG